MSTVVKIIVFLLLLIGLIVGGGVYLQHQMTPERVRDYITPLLESSLERKVSLGEIEIGLLSGITVSDLKIKKQHSETDDFVTVQQVNLHYQLWSLVTGHIVVNEVALINPVISVQRYHDGRYNFSDLINKNQSHRSSSYKEKSVAIANDIFSLLVEKVVIQDGSLVFLDAADNKKTPYRYKLSQLNINVRNFTLDEKFPFDLSVQFNDAQLDLSGHYNLALKSGDFVVHLTPLDLIPLSPYYRKQIPGKVGAGKLGLNVEFDVTPERLISKGKVSLDDLDVAIDATAFRSIDLSADYSISYDHSTERMSISTFIFNFAGIETSFDGSVDLASSSPVIDLSMVLKQFDLRQLMNVLPQSLIRNVKKYSLAGTLDGRVDLEGAINQPAELFKSARLSLADVQVSTETLRLGVSGDLSYFNDLLKTDGLSISYGNQVMSLTLDAKKSTGGIFKGSFDLNTDLFDFNEVIGSANVSAQPEDIPRNDSVADLGPFHLPLDMIGTLSARSIKYRNLVLDQVYADAQIKNNRLRLQNMRLNLGNGRIKAESNLNLAVPGLAYSGDIQVTDMDVAALYQGLYPYSGYEPSGILRLNTTFSGYGTRQDRLLRALNMQGSFLVSDGQLLGFPILDNIANFIGGDDLRRVSFDDFSGQFQVANNTVEQSSQVNGSRMRVGCRGNIDLNGYTNLAIDTRIAPEVSRRSGVVADVLSNFSDEQGWGIIPLKISGPFERVKVSPNLTLIEQMVATRARQELLDKLSNSQQQDATVQDGVKKMLDNTLNKLFGN